MERELYLSLPVRSVQSLWFLRDVVAPLLLDSATVTVMYGWLYRSDWICRDGPACCSAVVDSVSDSPRLDPSVRTLSPIQGLGFDGVPLLLVVVSSPRLILQVLFVCYWVWRKLLCFREWVLLFDALWLSVLAWMKNPVYGWLCCTSKLAIYVFDEIVWRLLELWFGRLVCLGMDCSLVSGNGLCSLRNYWFFLQV